MKTPEWYVLKDGDGTWYWHKKDHKGKVIARSVQPFSSKGKAARSAFEDAKPFFMRGEDMIAFEGIARMVKSLHFKLPGRRVKGLRVEDLRGGMKVEIGVNDGKPQIIAFLRPDISGEIGISTDDGYGFLTHDWEYNKDVVSVYETTKGTQQ